MVALRRLAAILLLTVPAAGGGAQEPALENGKTPPAVDSDKTFVALDLNADGRLSREEARVVPELEAQFDGLDTNQDGFLSPAEHAQLSTGAWRPPTMSGVG